MPRMIAAAKDIYVLIVPAAVNRYFLVELMKTAAALVYALRICVAWERVVTVIRKLTIAAVVMFVE